MTTTEKIVNLLDGRKRPLTTAQIAEKTNSSLSTVKRTITDLKSENVVQVAGIVYTDKPGRPAHKYLLA